MTDNIEAMVKKSNIALEDESKSSEAGGISSG